MTSSSPSGARLHLTVCALLYSDALAQSLVQVWQGDSSLESPESRLSLIEFYQPSEFLQFMERTSPPVDCLILEDSPDLPRLIEQLLAQSILLPSVILQANADSLAGDRPQKEESPGEIEQPEALLAYHSAALHISIAHLSQIHGYIDEAIAKFLQLSSEGQLLKEPAQNMFTALTTHSSLMQQHKRLAEKLRERLGYLGVYYKRNPAHFLRHMTEQERRELLQQLKADYRQIILIYFSDEASLNQKIDSFVNLAFFADIPVAQIVEIHMELMDEFSKHLKLEGRSDEILLDYRLTLIDMIAHLCEMYRRSIPRES